MLHFAIFLSENTEELDKNGKKRKSEEDNLV
jgi:hypothetical protein